MSTLLTDLCFERVCSQHQRNECRILEPLCPPMATIARYWNAQCVESRSRLREGTLQWFSARISTLCSRQILFLHDCRKACCLQVHMVTKKSLHGDVIRVVEGREFVIIMAIAVVVSSQKSSIPFYPMLPIVGLVGFAQML